MLKFKKIIAILLVLSLLVPLTSCKDNNFIGELIDDNEETEDDLNQKVSGGELTVPITNVKSLNPLIAGSSSIYYFNKLIFEGLFELDDKLEPKEKLVKNYNINNDGSIDITLKDNIKWHDGKPLSTEDVEFTINTLKYAANNPNYSNMILDIYLPEGISNINNITNIIIRDSLNMTIYFDLKNKNILEVLNFPIVAKHVFYKDNNVNSIKSRNNKIKKDSYTMAYEKALDIENYNPIGTGPYKQLQHNKLKSIELGINENYWGKKPNIKTINGKILSNEELALVSFESGQVDLAFSTGTDWEKYTQDEKVNIKEFTSNRYEFLAFNFNNNIFEGEKGKALRKAISYGINRDNIIDRVYIDRATKTDVPINPNSWLISKNINNTYKYDVKKSRKILEDAGWKDTDGDKIYENEEGQKLSIKLTTNSFNDLRVRTLDIIAENLKAIGIEVIKDYEQIAIEGITEEVIENNWQSFERKIRSGNFEVALLGWDTSTMQNLEFMFHSSKEIGTENFIRYENEDMDKILDDINTFQTQSEKKKHYAELQKLIVDDLPYVSLFFTNGAILSNKKLYGNLKPSFENVYNDIDEWFIPKKYQSEE